MHIWGWMTPPELEWLIAEASISSSVVEIGSLHGRSAFAMLTACSGPVYCIDPWNDEGGHCYPSFMGNCGHFPNLRAIQDFSPAVAVTVPDADMVFIDGNHDYDAVMADLNAWYPKTKRIICGHDYQSEGFPGVSEAVDEFFGDRAYPVKLRGWDEGISSIWAVDIA